MAYGQQSALRTQTTKLSLNASGWTALQGSSALANRFAVKIYVVGTGGASRVGLSYDNVVSLKDASHWLSSGQFRVEPAATGLTLRGIFQRHYIVIRKPY